MALRLPLVHGGERVGTLVLGARAHGEPLDEADRRLLDDFARHAAAAVSAIALAGEVQRSRERLVSAREEERRRLSGDLHDGLGPTLAGAILTIEAARGLLTRDPEAVDRLLDRAAASIEATVADIRRLVYGLRPPALDQLGLVGAIRQQATALSSGDGQIAVRRARSRADATPSRRRRGGGLPDRAGGAHERRATCGSAQRLGAHRVRRRPPASRSETTAAACQTTGTQA